MSRPPLKLCMWLGLLCLLERMKQSDLELSVVISKCERADVDRV